MESARDPFFDDQLDEEQEEPIEGDIAEAAIADVESVLKEIEDGRAEAARVAEERRRSLRTEFVAIIARDDLPRRNDRARLTQIIRELGISSDEARRDVALIHRVRELLPQGTDARVVQTDRDTQESFRHRQETLERHTEELAACDQHYSDCCGEEGHVKRVRDELLDIYRASPHLFECADLNLPASLSPPRE